MAAMNGQAMGILLLHIKSLRDRVFEIYLQTGTPLSPWQVQDILQQIRVWECHRKGIQCHMEVDIKEVQYAIHQNGKLDNIRVLPMTRTGRDGEDESLWTLNKKKFPTTTSAEQKQIF